MGVSFSQPYALLPVLLVAHGAIGAVDTIVNHELIARLPQRIEAKREVGLHALREAVYAMLFGAIAWFDWHGAWAVPVALILLASLVIDAADEFVENLTRVLPQNERLLHFTLILNLGFITLAMLPILRDWYAQPSGLVPADHGLLSLILSVCALGAALWSLRDLLAWLSLRKKDKAASGLMRLASAGQTGK